MDHEGMEAGPPGVPCSSTGAVAGAASARRSGVSAPFVDPLAAAGRQNSSGSTGSDETHPGSSPSSISNYRNERLKLTMFR